MADWDSSTTIAPAGRDTCYRWGNMFHIWLKADFPSENTG